MRHDVICADNSTSRVEQLSNGVVSILEEGLPNLIREMIDKGRLRFTNSNIEAVLDAEFVFLCLPTPEGPDGHADLSAIEAVALEIGPHLLPNSVVINKSTVPVGTAFLVKDLLRRRDVDVVSNPEFLSEGSAVLDFLQPDRIVIGAESSEVGYRVAELYGDPSENNCIVVDIPSAELIKYASNAYLATRLTFINSIATFCEAVGADIQTVSVGMGADRRIGPSFLIAGPGWGGSCFPKDTQALIQMAEKAGCELSLVKAVVEANAGHIRQIAIKVANALGGSLAGKVVAVWGLTFKAGTDDTRNSPSLKIIDILKGWGAIVVAFDPVIHGPIEGLRIASSKEEACIGADVLLIGTEWSEFALADLSVIGGLMSNRIIVDSRNIIDMEEALSAGFEYTGVGRGIVKTLEDNVMK
jgi:UDPglucose 6-dehydrogenase